MKEEHQVKKRHPTRGSWSSNSVNSFCAIRGDHSIDLIGYYDKKVSTSGNPEISLIEYELEQQVKATHRDSKRYKEGWSPTCNGTTEAFFTNFQDGYLNWAGLWPNTRIPRSHTTPTRELEGFRQIVVDLDLDGENIASKQVPSCTSNVDTPIDLVRLRLEEKVQEIEEYQETILEEQRIFKLPFHQRQQVKKTFIGAHNYLAYSNFYQIINQTLEDPYYTSRSCSYINDEESTLVIKYFTEYVNKKGRRKVHGVKSGIDKVSSDYIPWSKPKFNPGPSYCIQVLDNPFKNHILGSVGFTTVEYFGHLLLESDPEDTEVSYTTCCRCEVQRL